MPRYLLRGFRSFPWFAVISMCLDSRCYGATSSKGHRPSLLQAKMLKNTLQSLFETGMERFHPLYLKVVQESGLSQSEAGDGTPSEGTGSWMPASDRRKSDEEDFATAVAAASHCAALYATGHFPAHQGLGVFELDAPSSSIYSQTVGGLMVTAGDIKIGFELPKAPGVADSENTKQSSSVDSNDVSADSRPGVVTVEILLEVPLQAISARTAAAAVAAAAAAVKSQGEAEQQHETEERRPSQSNVVDYTEYENLALFELVTASKWDAGSPTVRVDVVAAYGYHGDITTGQILVPLTRSDGVMTTSQASHDAHPDESAAAAGEISSIVESTMILRGTVDWTPEAEMWTALVGGTAVVADVKISDPYAMNDHMIPNPLLLHATLCKHGTEGGEPTRTGARSVVEFQATLTPFDTQRDCTRRPSTDNLGCNTEPSQENICTSRCDASSDEVVLTELADPAWTVERGRGLDAVLALPRRVDWKPGQWREERLKQERQQELQERRRARESAYRKTRSKHGRDSNVNRGSTGSDGNVICRYVAQTLDAVKRKWRKFRRRQRRRRSKS